MYAQFTSAAALATIALTPAQSFLGTPSSDRESIEIPSDAPAPRIRIFGDHFVGVPFDVEVLGEAHRSGYVIVAASETSWLGVDTQHLSDDQRDAFIGDELRRQGRPVPFRTDATGRAVVRVPEWPAGTVGYLQAVMSPSASSGTELVTSVTSAPMQTAIDDVPLDVPVITGFSVDSAGPGEVVTITGFNFGNGDTDEVGVWRPEPEIFDFTTLSRTDTALDVRMLPFGGDPVAPGPLRITTGAGGTVQLPDFAGFEFGEPAIAQCFGFDAPSSTSSIIFTPDVPPGPGSGACSGPSTSGYKRVGSWKLNADGDIVLQVPQEWCGSDTMFLRLFFRRQGTDDDRMYNEEIVFPLSDPCSNFSGSLATNILAAALQAAFNDVPITCTANADPVALTVTVSCNVPIAYLWSNSGLFVNYGPTNLSVETGGVDDDFNFPADPAAPSPDLGSYITANWGFGLDFDCPPFANALGHTFTAIPAQIRAGVLEVRMQPVTALSSDDRISLVFNGNLGSPGFAWSGFIRDLPEAGGTWALGDNPATTFCLDLQALPTSTGPVSIIPDICDAGALDVLIEDYTMVDYMDLRTLECD